MSWGETYWSSYWGSGGGYSSGRTRLLQMDREGPNFRKLADIIDNRYLQISGVLSQIEVGYDLDTAVGEQLNVLGALLGLERQGMADERYRRALKVQRRIISSRGTAPEALAVVLDWTGAEAIDYRNVYPNTVEITATVSEQDEAALWRFIAAVLPTGRPFTLYATTEPAELVLIGDYTDDPITDPGVTDYTDDPVAGARVTTYEVTP